MLRAFAIRVLDDGTVDLGIYDAPGRAELPSTTIQIGIGGNGLDPATDVLANRIITALASDALVVWGEAEAAEVRALAKQGGVFWHGFGHIRVLEHEVQPRAADVFEAAKQEGVTHLPGKRRTVERARTAVALARHLDRKKPRTAAGAG